MEFLTKSQLRSERNSIENRLQKSVIIEAHSRNYSIVKTSVFLSHKHDDFDVLKDVMAVMEDANATLYIDWLDNNMPSHTSGQTAASLKTKIKACKKFVFIASQKAIDSKWCNWELGLGDADKFPNNIAIFVVKEDNGNWTGNEYLSIYPAIGRKYRSFEGDYQVQFPDGRIIDLNRWLDA